MRRLSHDTTLVSSICFEMRYAANKREAAVAARHGGVLRPGLDRGGRRLCAGAPRLDRASRSAVTRSGSRTRTAGRRGSRGCAMSGCSTRASPARCATARSSTGSASTSAPPTCSTRRPASSVEYDGALHLSSTPSGAIDRDREEAFRRVGLEYFTIMRGDFVEPRRAWLARMDEARRRARWPRRSRPRLDHRAPALVDPDVHRRPAPQPGRPDQRARLLRSAAGG